MFKRLPLLGIVAILCSPHQTSAHYLWVTIDNQSGDQGVTRIFFEESPSAGDGHYLDHFSGTSKTWFRSVEQMEPELLNTSDVNRGNMRWLEAKLPAGSPRSIDCYGKFGVYKYGQTNVLLHYYARNLNVRTNEDLNELGRAEHMDLDIVPHDSVGEVEVTVLWKGKPAAERMVYIRGPEKFKQNIETDGKGRVQFTPVTAGVYTLRTSVEEPTPGWEGGQDYALIRHNCTIMMQLPLEK